MFEIRRPSTAFSVTRQRRPREKREGHLEFVRSLPCCVCLTRKTVEAAHLRAPSPRHGKRATGMGEKPSDQWTVPLCHEEHMAQHHHGDELGWWASKGIDPFSLATALWASSGDEEAALQIIEAHQSRPMEKAK